MLLRWEKMETSQEVDAIDDGPRQTLKSQQQQSLQIEIHYDVTSLSKWNEDNPCNVLQKGDEDVNNFILNDETIGAVWKRAVALFRGRFHSCGAK